MNFSFFFFALSFAFRETKAKANSTPISNTREVSSGLKHCANSGKTEESCRMQCNWDGSCIEIVETRTCTCNGDSKIKTFSTVFKDGHIVGLNHGHGVLRTCDIMPMRCTECYNNGQAKKSNSWKSANDVCFLGTPTNMSSNVGFPVHIPQQTTLSQPIVPVTTTAPQTTASNEPTVASTTANTVTDSTIVDISSSSTTTCRLRGLIKESCHMNCNWDGSCEETIETKECGCSQIEHHLIKKTTYLNGIVQGNNMGIGALGTCQILPLRCSMCKRGGQASLARSWRSQQTFCAWGSPINEGSTLVVSPGNKD